MKNVYCPWKTRRFVIHNTVTDEWKEFGSIRYAASIIAEWVNGWTRGDIWALVAHAVRTGELVRIGELVFIDTRA